MTRSDDAIVQARALRLDDETQWRDDDTVPYGMFWRPWIEVGHARLFHAHGRSDGSSAPRARAPTSVAAGARRSPRGARCVLWARSTSRDPGPYRSWIRDQLADGYDSLFKTYPVLSRLLSVITSQWVEVSAELLARAFARITRYSPTVSAFPSMTRSRSYRLPATSTTGAAR